MRKPFHGVSRRQKAGRPLRISAHGSGHPCDDDLGHPLQASGGSFGTRPRGLYRRAHEGVRSEHREALPVWSGRLDEVGSVPHAQTGLCAQVYLGAQKLSREVGSLYQVNCEAVARLAGRRGDVSTIWSRVQNFVADRQIRLHGGTDKDPILTSISIGARNFSGNLCKILLQELWKERAQFYHRKWLSAPEQGGLAQPLGCASESNYWWHDCHYLRYREYRFAIKARLNLLPVAAQKRKFGKPMSETPVHLQ